MTEARRLNLPSIVGVVRPCDISPGSAAKLEHYLPGIWHRFYQGEIECPASGKRRLLGGARAKKKRGEGAGAAAGRAGFRGARLHAALQEVAADVVLVVFRPHLRRTAFSQAVFFFFATSDGDWFHGHAAREG